MTAPTVLLLPGLLEDAEVFHACTLGLADIATTRVVDLTQAATVADLARQAHEQAPPGPLHLAGHSMGGYVALEIVRQAPARVAGLALLNTHARPDSPEATANRRRLLALADHDFKSVIETLLPKLMTAAHVKDPALAGIVDTMALGVGKEAFVRQQEAIIHRPDSRPTLATIRVPTLVVAGREDQLMPLEWLTELAAGIPGARLEVIDGCGHLSPIEKPREVIALLRRWLTGRDHPMPEFTIEAPPPAS